MFYIATSQFEKVVLRNYDRIEKYLNIFNGEEFFSESEQGTHSMASLMVSLEQKP